VAQPRFTDDPAVGLGWVVLGQEVKVPGSMKLFLEFFGRLHLRSSLARDLRSACLVRQTQPALATFGRAWERALAAQVLANAFRP
jgi:hypothetical protein